MSNQTKHLLLIVAVIVAFLAIAEIDLEFYRTLMSLIGGWQLGTWCGNYSRKRWPLG